jgi:CopG family nickel-responsive transcriptional regulator
MSDIERISLSIEKTLLVQLERLVAASHYENRSEFIRDLIRNCLVDQEWAGGQDLLGTISLVYDHHVRGLTERLTEIQHAFAGQVLATTHIHLDHQLCAEMIMVRGCGQEIKALADQLQREKGVLHARLAAGTTGQQLRRPARVHAHPHRAR